MGEKGLFTFDIGNFPVFFFIDCVTFIFLEARGRRSTEVTVSCGVDIIYEGISLLPE